MQSSQPCSKRVSPLRSWRAPATESPKRSSLPFPYRFSLLSLMGYSAYFGIAAVIVSVLSLVISVFGRSAIGRRGIAVAILALAAGGLTAYVPWHYRSLARSVPPIDDITTDTDNPPAFVAVIKLCEAAEKPGN